MFFLLIIKGVALSQIHIKFLLLRLSAIKIYKKYTPLLVQTFPQHLLKETLLEHVQNIKLNEKCITEIGPNSEGVIRSFCLITSEITQKFVTESNTNNIYMHVYYIRKHTTDGCWDRKWTVTGMNGAQKTPLHSPASTHDGVGSDCRANLSALSCSPYLFTMFTYWIMVFVWNYPCTS